MICRVTHFIIIISYDNFIPTKDIADFTTAEVRQKKKMQTRHFARSSTPLYLGNCIYGKYGRSTEKQEIVIYI